MNSPNQCSKSEKLESLEKKLSEMNDDQRARVKEIEQMFMDEWARDREPEYKPGPEDAERALEYALGFVDKGKPILILDRSGESSALASTLEDVLKPYHHFLRSVSSLDEAISFASQLKFRLVIADSAPEDKRLKSGFLGQIKSNYESTSTVLILGQEDEIVDTRVIDAVIRKPFDPTDGRIVKQVNYYCVVGDVREKKRNIDSQKYEIKVANCPDINFFQYQHLLEHNTHDIEILLSSSFDFSSEKPEVAFRGDAEYPGAATGKVYASFQRAMHSGMLAKNLIFYVDDLSEVSLQEIKILRGAGGIMFGNISRLNHHVIDFRSAGIPMIHCKRVPRNKEGKYEKGEFAARDGTKVSFDGGSREIYTGNFDVKPSPITNRLFEDDTETVADFDSIMRSCDEVLDGRMNVMINADNVEAAEAARKFGAKYIGLVRSENVLKEKPENILIYGAYLLAQITGDSGLIEKTREPFKKMQEDAFYDVLEYQKENRTQIRLLDPPLNEFFDDNIIDEIAKKLPEASKEHVQRFKDNVNDPVKQKTDRGVVLGARYPGIYEAQIDAIFAAYQRLKDEGQENMDLKIFIPYVINLDQIRLVKGMAESLNAQRYSGEIDYNLGVTLETVPGVMSAPRMLEMGIKHFTFGTNDLFPAIENSERNSTDRDDYHLDDQGNLIMNPAIVDTMRLCLKRIAATGIGRDQYEVGISGEMNPIKLENLKDLMPALNYVSASRPSQVPVIKLKLAQIYVRQHTGDMKKE